MRELLLPRDFSFLPERSDSALHYSGLVWLVSHSASELQGWVDWAGRDRGLAHLLLSPLHSLALNPLPLHPSKNACCAFPAYPPGRAGGWSCCCFTLSSNLGRRCSTWQTFFHKGEKGGGGAGEGRAGAVLRYLKCCIHNLTLVTLLYGVFGGGNRLSPDPPGKPEELLFLR